MSQADPLDAAEFLAAVDRLADRLRAMPRSRLRAPVPGYPSCAAAGLALCRRLAAEALAREGRPPYEFPDAGEFAVADQLAVAGHDLALVAARDRAALTEALAAVRQVAGLIDQG